MPYTLITGGAGFVGANLADRLLLDGRPVLIFDDLSRPVAEQNLRWLRQAHGDALDVTLGDVRDRKAVLMAVSGADQVFHFAAQAAVSASIVDPLDDFSVNAQGTLNVLEAIRAQPSPPLLVLTSTNEVYGSLDDVPLECSRRRYVPVDAQLRAHGVSEARPLDFRSPYGCSKGAADQYVHDYARTYGLPAVVFRMSCIYGPRQLGTEDEGWVAHFLVRAIDRQPITLHGDGRQVRDVLFIDDLVDAFLLAQRNIAKLSGQAFNIGGGSQNAISLIELLDRIAALRGIRPRCEMRDWRTGDQRYFVADSRRFQQATGWKPKIGMYDGIERLYYWLLAQRGLTPERRRTRIGVMVEDAAASHARAAPQGWYSKAQSGPNIVWK